MKVKINVTKNDIRRGVPCRESMCPIALAFRRAKISAYVTIHDGVRHLKRHSMICHLPSKAMQFVRAFDAGKTVEPFSFVVEFDGRKLR